MWLECEHERRCVGLTRILREVANNRDKSMSSVRKKQENIMKDRLARVCAFAAVCAALALAMLAPVASAELVTCESIGGLGSSLQNEAQAAFAAGFSALTPGQQGAARECSSYPAVRYVPTSSGSGLEQWGAPGKKLGTQASFPSFIGDDVGAETTQLTEMGEAGKNATENNNETVVPVAQSAIAAIVTLPLGCHGVLDSGTVPEITNSLYQRLWRGNLELWLNVFQNLLVSGTNCDTDVIRLGRASASGTSCGVKRLFANLANEPTAEKAEWESDVTNVSNCLSTVKWPSPPSEEAEVGGAPSVKLEKGSQLVQAVYESPGSIGYADLADAIATGKFAAGGVIKDHKNTTGKFAGELLLSFFALVGNGKYGSTKSFASPEATGGGSNCKEVEYAGAPKTKAGEAGWAKVIPTNTEAEGAKNYPDCTLTFDTAWRMYSFPLNGGTPLYTLPLLNTVTNYLLYAVSKPGQELLPTHHFGELPAAIRTGAETGIKEAGNILF
jgi:ABC-type phosphate transport system substrate-binding protein